MEHSNLMFLAVALIGILVPCWGIADQEADVVDKKPKPGQCPAIGFNCGPGDCVADVDCPGSQKCCQTGCGKTACLEPWPENLCNLPKDVGPCDAIVPRWYFDPMSQTCKTFDWGGCGGNANKFETEADCEEACVKCGECPVDEYTICDITECLSDNDCTGLKKCCINACGSRLCHSPENICNLPKVVGPCKALSLRWYYDTNSQSCLQFNYGGCQGNANNFATEADCKEECVKCGDCPVDEVPIDSDLMECSSDNDCCGQKKCCTNDRDSRLCRSPAKKGVCPGNGGGENLRCHHHDDCSINDDCPGDQLCCPGGCGNQCVNPAGVCPGNNEETLIETLFCHHQCDCHGDCPGEQLCCPAGACGNRCLNPSNPET